LIANLAGEAAGYPFTVFVDADVLGSIALMAIQIALTTDTEQHPSHHMSA
jgi:hypothetical protein